MRWRTGLVLVAVAAAGAACARHEPLPAGAVRITVTDDGFDPALVAVARGRPVTLVFTRRSDHTCATDVVFANGGPRVDLPLGEAVRVDLPPLAGDTLTYACGMDMYHGKIIAK
jgi:plastocyanin domain-containing protein